MNNRTISVTEHAQHIQFGFQAMACDCEILIKSQPLSSQLQQQITQVIQQVWRIEHKYSRFNQHSLCHQINHAQGESTAIDNETFALLQFANSCYQLSDGLFDISCSSLNQLWPIGIAADFTPPSQQQIERQLSFVGWHQVQFDQHHICLPVGMQLDFGGIAKEYAVDSSCQLLQQLNIGGLVNLGGDIAISPQPDKSWTIAIDNQGYSEKAGQLQSPINLDQGAIATSGQQYRSIVIAGKRYSHIINPKTGWPLINPHHSITVLSDSCLQAGMLTTIALLHETNAINFLQSQGVQFVVY